MINVTVSDGTMIYTFIINAPLTDVVAVVEQLREEYICE